MRQNIIEMTEADVIASDERKFFRPVFVRTPAIPAAYDGKYAVLCALAVDTELSEAQMDQLETAIEGITGVHKTFVLVGPARLPLDRVPDGHDLKIGCEGSFRIEPVPE